MNKVPQVVIVGGGFGGTYTARYLMSAVRRGEIKVTLINRTNYFLFTPLLHEVATGGLSPTATAEPLREIFSGSGVTIRESEVSGVDPARKVVSTDDGEVPHDYLVVSAGAETNFYGIPGAALHSLVLKNLADAVKIRDRVVESFEQAVTLEPSERAKKLSFVVVGGGATGVELVTELAELIHDTLCPYYGSKGKTCHAATITLVSSDQDLLAVFPPRMRATAKAVLKRKGINLRLGVKVTEVTVEEIKFSDGSSLPASVVFWTAGVKPSPLGLPEAERHPNGRIIIDEYLRAKGVENIFVIGDLAAPLPMLAQVAVEQARVLAGNILALLITVKLQRMQMAYPKNV